MSDNAQWNTDAGDRDRAARLRRRHIRQRADRYAEGDGTGRRRGHRANRVQRTRGVT
jgi:hypothetical protein